jgi:polysaccharide export outer membrane protein
MSCPFVLSGIPSNLQTDIPFAACAGGGRDVHGVRRITLALAVCLSAPFFSRAVTAQEIGRILDVGRVPGETAANSATVGPTVESQVPDRTDSATVLRGDAPVPARADSTGDPVLGRDRYPLYRLHTGDVVEVSFTFSPELNQVLNVAPDGFIRLKGAASIRAQALTLPQLENGIRAAYAGVLHDPEISVTLKEFEKPYFLTLGQVSHPGKFELRSDITVSEAMAMAGGFTQQARHSQVVLFRRVSDELVEARVLNLKKMLQRRDLREDLHLKPGDLLYVPQSTVSKMQRFMPSAVLGTYVNPLQP